MQPLISQIQMTRSAISDAQCSALDVGHRFFSSTPRMRAHNVSGLVSICGTVHRKLQASSLCSQISQATRQLCSAGEVLQGFCGKNLGMLP
jgi:hypothetical protein